MSGGRFEYNQYKIHEIAEDIESEIYRSGKKKTPEELKDDSWRGEDWYGEYPDDLKHYEYPPEVIEEFKKGVKLLKQAAVYAQRIDWLLSGDDGEETFLERLEEDLKKLSK